MRYSHMNVPRHLTTSIRLLKTSYVPIVTHTAPALTHKVSLQSPSFRYFHALTTKFNMSGAHDIKDLRIGAKPLSTTSDPKADGNDPTSDCVAAASKFAKSYPSLNPIDVYRIHIAEHLATITGVEAPEVYTKLQWTQTQDKGDLMLAVPALRVKGKKPNELAAEWAEKACPAASLSLLKILMIASFLIRTLWRNPSPLDPSFSSSSSHWLCPRL